MLHRRRSMCPRQTEGVSRRERIGYSTGECGPGRRGRRTLVEFYTDEVARW